RTPCSLSRPIPAAACSAVARPTSNSSTTLAAISLTVRRPSHSSQIRLATSFSSCEANVSPGRTSVAAPPISRHSTAGWRSGRRWSTSSTARTLLQLPQEDDAAGPLLAAHAPALLQHLQIAHHLGQGEVELRGPGMRNHARRELRGRLRTPGGQLQKPRLAPLVDDEATV